MNVSVAFFNYRRKVKRTVSATSCLEETTLPVAFQVFIYQSVIASLKGDFSNSYLYSYGSSRGSIFVEIVFNIPLPSLIFQIHISKSPRGHNLEVLMTSSHCLYYNYWTLDPELLQMTLCKPKKKKKNPSDDVTWSHLSAKSYWTYMYSSNHRKQVENLWSHPLSKCACFISVLTGQTCSWNSCSSSFKHICSSFTGVFLST